MRLGKLTNDPGSRATTEVSGVSEEAPVKGGGEVKSEVKSGVKSGAQTGLRAAQGCVFESYGSKIPTQSKQKAEKERR